MPVAPAITPAVTTTMPATVPAAATVKAAPAVTPAVSSPLHVRHVIDRSGGSGRQREDGCRLSSCGRARKNETCNTNRKHRA
jgi:hypothetical protein